jgi:hypothetical protein
MISGLRILLFIIALSWTARVFTCPAQREFNISFAAASQSSDVTSCYSTLRSVSTAMP